MDFDQETVRASGRPPQYALPATVPPLGPEDFPESETAVMAPRKEHPPDLIRIPGFSISVDGALRLMDRFGKLSIPWLAAIFVMVMSGIVLARYGDSVVATLVEREKANAAAIARLATNDADREKRDKMIYDLMVRIVDKLETR